MNIAIDNVEPKTVRARLLNAPIMRLAVAVLVTFGLSEAAAAPGTGICPTDVDALMQKVTICVEKSTVTKQFTDCSVALGLEQRDFLEKLHGTGFGEVNTCASTMDPTKWAPGRKCLDVLTKIRDKLLVDARSSCTPLGSDAGAAPAGSPPAASSETIRAPDTTVPAKIEGSSTGNTGPKNGGGQGDGPPYPWAKISVAVFSVLALAAIGWFVINKRTTVPPKNPKSQQMTGSSEGSGRELNQLDAAVTLEKKVRKLASELQILTARVAELESELGGQKHASDAASTTAKLEAVGWGRSVAADIASAHRPITGEMVKRIAMRALQLFAVNRAAYKEDAILQECIESIRLEFDLSDTGGGQLRCYRVDRTGARQAGGENIAILISDSQGLERIAVFRRNGTTANFNELELFESADQFSSTLERPCFGRMNQGKFVVETKGALQ